MDSPSLYRGLKHQRDSVCSSDDAGGNTEGRRGQKRTSISSADSPPSKKRINQNSSNNNKQLFIGNLPSRLQCADELRRFLEEKSRALELWTEAHPAILNVRAGRGRYAYVDVVTEDFAILLLSLDRRIEFNGQKLAIQLPKKSVPIGYSNNTDNSGRGNGRRRFSKSSTTSQELYRIGHEVQSHEKKQPSGDLSDLNRQLYVVNIPGSMRNDSGRFKEFLTKQILTLGLTNESDEAGCGELVYNVDLLKGDTNGEGSAFVEFASESITTSCLRRMNGVFCDGQPLKINRPKYWKNWSKLYVGSVPRWATEDLLREFVLNMLKTTGMLGTSCENPIAEIKVAVRGQARGSESTHAFITFETKEQARLAMQLNGIPYMGYELSFERPSWWKPSSDEEDNLNNWCDALRRFNKNKRRSEEYNCSLDDEALCTLVLTDLHDSKTYAKTEMLNFLSSAMKMVGLSLYNGDPVVDFERYDLNGGVVKFRSETEATRALMLNQIPFNGYFLNFERPPNYPGDYRGNPTRIWPEVVREFYERHVHMGPSKTANEDGSTVTAPVSPDYHVAGNISIAEYQRKIDDLQHVLNNKERELSHATEEILNLEANRYELSGKISTLEDEKSKADSDLEEAHKLIRGGKEKIQKLESDVSDLRRSQETSEKAKSELKDKLQKANADYEALRAKNIKCTKCMQLEQQICQLKSIDDDANQKLKISEHAQAELSKKLETAEETKTVQSERLDNVQADFESLKTEFDRMKETNDSLNAQLNSMPSSSTTTQGGDNGEMAKKLHDIETKYHKVVDQMTDAMGEILRQQSSYRELQKDRDEIRKDRDKHKNLREQAERDLDLMRRVKREE